MIKLEKKLLGSTKTRLENTIYDTELKINIAIKELEMVSNLISFNVKKYLVTLNNSNNKSCYELDQLCSHTDKTVGYIRRIILKIPDIVDKMYKSHNSKYILNNIKLKNLDKKFNFLKEKQMKAFMGIPISFDEIEHQIEKKDVIDKLGLCYHMDEDIKKDMIDLIEQRCYAKKEKIIKENKKIEKVNYYYDECEEVITKIRKKKYVKKVM